MSDKERYCKNCTWWHETDEVITVPEGWCHRMPHTEPTGGIDFCGEFKDKNPDTKTRAQCSL